MTPITSARSGPRFRGRAASPRAQHLAAGTVVFGITACAIAGATTGLGFLVFFAVGAGAGYSLSGSV